MYTGNKLDNEDKGKLLQVRQLSLVTSHPYFPFCRHITLHFMFFRNCFWSYFLLIKLYPCICLSRECGLFKASDLLLGDHVCEKSDSVKGIDCP